MWPFASRGSRGAAVAPTPSDLPKFSQYELNDASIKVWLPQLLSERLDWISKRKDASRPDVIRALLFEHLYGRIAYLALLEFEANRRAERLLADARGTARHSDGVGRETATSVTNDPAVMFSRSRTSQLDAEIIGKPTDNLRLELPGRLKEDLARVARVHGLTPSSYVRKALVQELCGEDVHTRWQYAIGRVGRDVERLERDD